MVNPNGREIKAVEFVTRKKTGAVLTERVEPQSQSATRLTFTFSQKMDTTFDSGDQLYMRVIDKEERTIVFDGVETGMDMVYPEVYTGLSFYVPTIEVIPQSYAFEQLDTVNVPVFGDMAAKANTGRLSLQYQKYGDYENAPYALQAFFPLALNTQLKTPAGVVQEVWAGKTGKAPDTKKQMEDAQAKGTPQDAIDAVDGTVKDTTGKAGADPEALQADANAAAAPKSSSTFFKKVPLSISFLLALEFDFFYDETENTYNLAVVQGFIGGSLSGIFTQPFTIYGVPMFGQVQAGVSMQISFVSNLDGAASKISADNFARIENLASFMEPQCDVQFGVNLKLTVGLGIARVANVHGSILGDLYCLGRVNVEGMNVGTPLDEAIDWSYMVKFGGSIGVDLFVTALELTVEPTMIATGAYSMLNAAPTLPGTRAPFRAYDGGDGDVDDFGLGSSLKQSGNTAHKALLENAHENSRPQMIVLPNQRKFLVFLNRDTGEGRENPSALMYSICDSDGHWSLPEAVQPDNTYDACPILKMAEDKVLIAWANASAPFGDDMNIADKLSTFNLNYCFFDPAADSLGEIKILSGDDAYMNVDPQLAFGGDGEEKIAFYLKRDISEVASDEEMLDNIMDGDASYSTLAFKIYNPDTDSWGAEKYLKNLHPNIEDPYLIDYTAETVKLNGATVVFGLYTVDEDENDETAEDRNAYLSIYNSDLDKSYPAIRLTDHNGYKTNPQIFQSGEDLYLAWLSDGNAIEMVNLSGFYAALSAEQIEALRNGDQSYGWHEDLLDALEMENFGIETKRFYDENGAARPIGNFRFCAAGEDIFYLLWTAAAGDEKDMATEIYAAPYYRNVRANGEEPLRHETAGWGNVVRLTDAGKTIGAYDIAAAGEGNLAIVAATYGQEMKPEGGLLYANHALSYFSVDATAKLTIENDAAWLENPLAKPGEETALCLNLLNQGLEELKGYEITVTPEGGGAALASFQSDAALAAGTPRALRIPITLPDTLSGLQFHIEATGNGETASYTVPMQTQPLLVYRDAAIMEDGDQFKFVGVLENTGNAASGPIAITPSLLDELDEGEEKNSLPVIELPSLEAGETLNFSENMDIPLDALNAYGGCLLSFQTAGPDFTIEEPLKLAASKRNPAQIFVNGGAAAIEMAAGETLPLEVALVPANVAQKGISKSTADHKIAAINLDGDLVAVGSGQTELIVVHNGTGLTVKIPISVGGGGDGGYDVDENGNALVTLDAERIDALRGDGTEIVIDLSAAPAGVKGGKITVDQDKMAREALGLSLLLPGGEKIFFNKDHWRSGGAPFTIALRKDGEKVDFRISRDGAEIGWANEENPVLLSLPYAVGGGENPDYIVMTGNEAPSGGEAEKIIPRSWYAEGGVWAKIYGPGSFRPLYNEVETFADIKGGWMESAVNYLRARGITEGVSTKKYGPSSPLTRAQYTTLLMRILAIEKGERPAAAFRDAAEIPRWAKDAVDLASALGIVNGYADQTFRPHASILRQEIFTMSHRAMDRYRMMREATEGGTPAFSDWGQTGSYAQGPIATLYDLGLIKGYKGKLKPLATATRAEAGQFLFNLLREDQSR